ncbi:MAG: pyridoxine 5'-phosphate synthase [Saprospiraceae bacterium]|nr:pyridoxine 5'-phosphate synthase [Saprospiraceae bacterium]
MTRLSVNLNKVALIRNSRGGNLPDVIRFARDCEAYGAEGITVHPRPDERHIRYRDVYALKEVVTTEFNIEGYPSTRFMEMVLEVKPHQCTLVPDPPDVLTSDTGWDTVTHHDFLVDIVQALQEEGIRVSLFLDPDPDMVAAAAATGADRIELYTGDYAGGYASDRAAAIAPHVATARAANEHKLGVNAGHDLNLDNLSFYAHTVPNLLEVSIGHALISDALYYGIQNVIEMYLRCLAVPPAS